MDQGCTGQGRSRIRDHKAGASFPSHGLYDCDEAASLALLHCASEKTARKIWTAPPDAGEAEELVLSQAKLRMGSHCQVVPLTFTSELYLRLPAARGQHDSEAQS